MSPAPGHGVDMHLDRLLEAGDPQATDHVLALVMELGNDEDARRLIARVGITRLAAVLSVARPGWFSARAWAFWHYRVGMTPLDRVPPPMPADAAEPA